MHDDQHGTAIISSAALLNALELQKKKIDKVKICGQWCWRSCHGLCKTLTWHLAPNMKISPCLILPE